MKDLAENNVKKENIIKNKMFDQIERCRLDLQNTYRKKFCKKILDKQKVRC